MKCKTLVLHSGLALLTSAAILAAPSRVFSQDASSQNMPSADRDNDVTRQELANFDHFLDQHPEIAEQLKKNPALVDDKQFVNSHEALKSFLADHPGVREEYKEHPYAFMKDEQRYDRREDQGRTDVTRQELANFDHFLDQHPEIAEQLKKNPALVDDPKFVNSHEALKSFLADHPGVREEYKEHPYAFMKDEQRYDRREDQGRTDVTRQELANFDHFLDQHPEIAEQLKKNPALVDDPKFVNSHEALKSFLADHPGVRQEYEQHPYAFMRDENRYDRHENGMGGNDAARGEVASFGGFLQNHDKVAGDLSRNPSLANNQEYLENHPELKSYLQQHPQANQQLSQNPQEFIASAQQVKPATGTQKMATDPKMK
ncbi:MAG TPA: hypothetical protein VND65_19275 [Candidatus Binatia bacterium]|nr:hypothetical protein [Candidatus Binatia bacterium]